MAKAWMKAAEENGIPTAFVLVHPASSLPLRINSRIQSLARPARPEFKERSSAGPAEIRNS
jgi:hypothetical protein